VRCKVSSVEPAGSPGWVTIGNPARGLGIPLAALIDGID
ncbi:MAG: hypothetical protein AVDCRST_MAG45-642, partial [uncultured Solirubrobacterales bacterium]